jgi:predicted nucleic acid-binding protein
MELSASRPAGGESVWMNGYGVNFCSGLKGRVLSIDGIVADNWGKVVARTEAAGRPIGAMDAFIAATAEAYGMTLVTRNTSDFETSLERIINPWAEDNATQ